MIVLCAKSSQTHTHKHTHKKVAENPFKRKRLLTPSGNQCITTALMCIILILLLFLRACVLYDVFI